MPKVDANGIAIHYDRQGEGEPLILIPYLAADRACYPFQVAEYARHFTCISVDPRGAGESDKPDGRWSTELLADDLSAFMEALGLESAHVFGLSLGAAIGLWLAAKHPARVKSLSIHGAWPKTDPFMRTVVESWQALAKGFGSVPEMVIRGIFPWCFTPELYAARLDYVDSLADFVRERRPQPVDAFMQQSDAVIAHDVEARLGSIKAPTQITFGRHDLLTSTRFADRFRTGIPQAEIVVFENGSHAPIHEIADEFNARTSAFLRRHSG